MSNYVFEHDGKQFTPSGVIKVEDAHNKEVERQELEKWALQPNWFYGYVDGSNITTFLGTNIGTVILSNTYKNNLGGKITSLRMRGTNGAVYYGRYGDWSNLCSFRKSKHLK